MKKAYTALYICMLKMKARENWSIWLLHKYNIKFLSNKCMCLRVCVYDSMQQVSFSVHSPSPVHLSRYIAVTM